MVSFILNIYWILLLIFLLNIGVIEVEFPRYIIFLLSIGFRYIRVLFILPTSFMFVLLFRITKSGDFSSSFNIVWFVMIQLCDII